MSIKLCSITDLKLLAEQNTTTNDDILEALIKLVGGQFELYTGRKFAKTSKVDYRDAGEKFYYVDTYPILEGTVTITYNSTVQTEDEDYYVWNEHGYIEFFNIPTKNRPKQIKLEWVGGYEEDSDGVLLVDEALSYACLLQCIFMFKRRRELGVSKLTLPDGSVSLIKTATLLPDVKTILNSYKKVVH